MLVIRPATLDDCGLLAAIEEAADRRYDDVDRPDLAETTGVPAEVAARYCADERLIVAEVDGELVGFVGWHIEDDPDTAGIAQVSVLPANGRQGIGTALMTAALDAIGRRGFDRVVLTTELDVAWNAPWYERLGFSVIPPDRWSEWMRDLVEQQSAGDISWTHRVWMDRRISPA